MAKAIVARALLGVRQYGICFAALLEALFRLGIVGIAVGMELQRELAIGALDLLIVRRARDAQHFVIVTFHCGGQNSTSLQKGTLNGVLENSIASFGMYLREQKLPTICTRHPRTRFTLEGYPAFELRATRTIAGRSSRSFNL